MDVRSDNLGFQCSTHKRVYENICHKCNKLLCGRCITIHNKEFDHIKYCDHIDDLKLNLNHQFGSDVNNNINSYSDCFTAINNNNHLNQRIETIWSTIKSSAHYHQSLATTETDITNHFLELHQYLIVEEQKLKRPIIQSKEDVNTTIDCKLKELKFLVNTINNHNLFVKYNGDIKKEYAQKNNHNSNNDNLEYSSTCSDSTDCYSIPKIMASILSCSTLSSFIQSNNNTLFCQYTENNNFDMRDLLAQYNNNIDSYTLDTIYKYNSQFKTSGDSLSNGNQDHYELEINKFDTNKLNELLTQSIKMSTVSLPPVIHTDNVLPTKYPFIFTTHTSKGATLIDINNKIIDEIQSKKYDFNGTYNSMVKVGDIIYIFGGFKNKTKYFRYSTLNGSIEVCDMDGIEGGRWISVCYDGIDHIYMINRDVHSRLDRYNIKTEKFEKIDTFGVGGVQILSLFYKGLIYSFSSAANTINIYDVGKHNLQELKIDKLFNATIAACTDGNGNVYLHSKDNLFIRFNIETNDTIELQPLGYFEQALSMTYQKISSSESYIYLLGGVRYNNHRYSIKNNQWENIFDDEKYERIYCSSTIFDSTYQLSYQA
ncbi:hypothetical protein PPL_03912 [Heterostelium album PN500]|uniref:C2H2-type domain-containing protein n=1 Tax=Heterostelium pallidum (strain ATCC 26659 / Pp 5 / PN500) TaxID=670386 RepID=D3B5H4_HETP5|nr:hypothetical protein PPL_03912 [Heterostelium album PN500]EFA83122.1 hypothetical protein PPL_03912 [Heterostelium album PN500]|eukprot:XP_020435239.1 hypothetical protein PPL_03912 [Heterostelium album PN500]